MIGLPKAVKKVLVFCILGSSVAGAFLYFTKVKSENFTLREGGPVRVFWDKGT